MTERLKSGQRQSGIEQFINRLRQFASEKTDRRKKFNEREFYNEDRTKKFVMTYGDHDDLGVRYEQVHLYALTLRKEGKPPKVIEGLNSILSLKKWVIAGITTFVIETEVVSDNPHHLTELFHYDSQGYLVEDHQYSWVQNEYRQEHKQRLVFLGCYKYADLPKRIDYESTGRLFLAQAKNLNFKTPQLIPYDFQAIGNHDSTSLTSL